MTEAKKPLLDEGGKSIVAVMAALLVAIFAFQLNASMLSPALVAMQNELSTTATHKRCSLQRQRSSRCSFRVLPT